MSGAVVDPAILRGGVIKDAQARAAINDLVAELTVQRGSLRSILKLMQVIHDKVEGIERAVTDAKQQAEKATAKAGSALAEATKRTSAHEIHDALEKVEYIEIDNNELHDKVRGLVATVSQVAARVDSVMGGLSVAVESERRVREKARDGHGIQDHGVRPATGGAGTT